MRHIFSIILLSASIIIPSGINDLISSGPSEPRVIVMGDSYAVNFFFDEQNKDLKLVCCAKPACTVEENKKIMLEGVDKFGTYLLLSISVNDQEHNINPSIFKDHLKDILEKAELKNKYVFVHTYCDAPKMAPKNLMYKASDYDRALRLLAQEYDNTFYIDMFDYCGSENFLEDGYHVKKSFNDALYERLLINVKQIEENVRDAKRKTNKG